MDSKQFSTFIYLEKYDLILNLNHLLAIDIRKDGNISDLFFTFDNTGTSEYIRFFDEKQAIDALKEIWGLINKW